MPPIDWHLLKRPRTWPDNATVSQTTVAFPDPAPSEARALIVGTGGFWACWAVGAIGVATNVSAFAFVFLGAFPFGAWMYFGGAYHVVARASGETVWQWYARAILHPFDRSRKGWGIGWMRVLLPSYYARSARVLGWSNRVVLSVLGSLLLLGLLLMVVMFATAPTGTRGH